MKSVKRSGVESGDAGWQACHCEEAAGRRGALSAKREEVPLGCNLGKAAAISRLLSHNAAGYCKCTIYNSMVSCGDLCFT